jgi:protease I
MGCVLGLLLIFSPLQIKPLGGTNILFIISHRNFNDKEYELPRDMLERLGARIVVASTDTTIAKGMHEALVKPDALMSQIKKVDFDAVIYIGGMGARVFWEDSVAHWIANDALERDKIIGAISTAPVILARSGVLRWKRATVWANTGTKHALKQEKVDYVEEPVVTAGKIVTANGPIAAKQFAEEIVRLLLKEDESDNTKSKRGGM